MNNKPTMTIDEYGTKFWKLNDKLHNENGPAVIWSDGSKFYYVNGKLQREDGPAIERSDGTKEYYVNDKRHREDGPAFVKSNGYKAYYVNGKRHNENGPAIIYSDGAKEYWVNGCKTTEYVVMNKTYEMLDTANFPGLFYIDEDGIRMVRIGCQNRSLEWWMKNGRMLGRKKGYSEYEMNQVEETLLTFIKEGNNKMKPEQDDHLHLILKYGKFTYKVIKKDNRFRVYEQMANHEGNSYWEPRGYLDCFSTSDFINDVLSQWINKLSNGKE